MKQKTAGVVMMLGLTAAAAVLSCGGTAAAQQARDPFMLSRQRMIEQDLKARDIRDAAVLKAMEKVQRHLFVDRSQWLEAYEDYPLPIGAGQTISQPYIVALMTQSLRLRNEDTVLEIGTGSGYQAAVLAELVHRVYSIEIIDVLAQQAAARLQSLGYKNITIKTGDGYQGWAEHAPYNAIILTCAAPQVPQPLLQQLTEGGRIILPLGAGGFSQELMLGIKKHGKLELKPITGVRFVPMVGEAQKKTPAPP